LDYVLKKQRYILCIDDETFILWNLKEQLKKKFSPDFLIETAESAQHAEDLISEIDGSRGELVVVICDQVMPGKKGDQFLTELHKTKPNTKKIMLTGQASVESIARAVNQADLFRFLSKPWEAGDLETAIKQAIEAYEVEKTQLKH